MWSYPDHDSEFAYYLDALLKPGKRYVRGGDVVFLGLILNAAFLLPLAACWIAMRKLLQAGLSDLTSTGAWLLVLIMSPGLFLLGWTDQLLEVAGPVALALYAATGAAMARGRVRRSQIEGRRRALAVSVGVVLATALLAVVAASTLHVIFDKQLGRRIVLPPSKHKWGYIDVSGRIAIAPRFDYARPFKDGMAAVVIRGRFGFIDMNGKLIAECKYREVYDFSGGMAAVRADRLFGFIDATGREVIPATWPEVGSFHGGLAMVNVGGTNPYHPDLPAHAEGGRMVLIDAKGAIVRSVPYQGFTRFCEGLARVLTESGWGFVDENWEIVIPPRFSFAGEFCEGLALAVVGKDIGYIDRSGAFAISPRFRWEESLGACDFSEGLAAAKQGDLWGYIDSTGSFQIPPRFEAPPGRFYGGLAWVTIGGRPATIDKNGGTVDPSRHIKRARRPGELIPVRSDEGPNRWGYMDENGTFSIEPQYLQAEDFTEGLAAVRVYCED